LNSIRYISILLFSILLLCGGCKKDEDNSRPDITLNSPVEYASFNVGDTMAVIGRVSHNKILNSVKIVIKDDNDNAITVPQFFYPNSYTYQIDFEYLIDVGGLESGTYTFVVTATDGSLTSNLFRNIMITGVDKQFERVIILTRPSILKTYVYALDELWTLENILNTDYGFTNSEISSGIRKLMMTKPEPSQLMVYDLDDIVEDQWIVAAPPYPVFNDILYDYKITYVASSNGDIKGVNQLGSTIYVTPLNSDTIPYLLHRHQNYMISYAESRGGPNWFISQHYLGTGSFRTITKIDFRIVSMFSMDASSCILFGNHADGSSIYEYHPDEPYLLKIRDLPPGDVIDVVSISPEDYLVAHSDGIYYFSAADGSLIEWMPGFETDNMVYDLTRGLLYCAKGHVVSVFRIDNGDLIQEINLPYPAYAMHIQYNI